jgi:predicted nucleic acid-binding Zn ribbon protein
LACSRLFTGCREQVHVPPAARKPFSATPLEQHEGCGGHVERVLSAPALQFKGTGWYVTDYARNSGNGKSSSKGENKSETKSENKSENKSETKSESSKSSTSTSTPDKK